MPTVNKPAMLVDQSLCVGCEACTAVCKQIYNLSKGVFRTKINSREDGSFPQTAMLYNKKACMHCKEAACVMACPTRACHKNELGLTVIDHRLCIECNYCVANCPFGAISFDRGRNLIEKCSLCTTRVAADLEPLCSEVCTSRIIKYGERDDMLEIARKRVRELRDQGHQDANIYGENELGGLRLLYVLQDSPDKYGLPVNPQISLGLQIWRYVPLGPAVLIAAGVVLGANYLYSRKIQGKVEEAKKAAGQE